MRSAGSSGPPSSGSGRIEGTAGTAAAVASPLASQQLERLGVAALGELQLPDPDPVEPGGGVGAHVVGEGGVQRRDLRDGEMRLHAGDPLTTFDI